MSFDVFNKAIGMLDADIIEAAEKAPAQAKPARVAAFAKRPWVKWVAAAAAIVVFAVGTPIALNMMGAFGGGNYVPPSGGESGNPGVVAPVDSDSESGESESSSVQSQEDASGSSEGEKPQRGDSSERSSEPPTQSESSPGGESENPSGSGQVPQSEPSETHDEPVTGGEPDSEDPQTGEFIKDNMPPLTFRIAGESKTFSYSVSEWVTTHWQALDSCYSIDHYVGSDGSSVLINSESGELIQYERTVLHGDSPLSVASEVEAIELAKLAVLNTDIAMSGLENAEVSVQITGKGYYVTLTVPEGTVFVHIDTRGSLLGIYVNKRGSWGIYVNKSGS